MNKKETADSGSLSPITSWQDGELHPKLQQELQVMRGAWRETGGRAPLGAGVGSAYENVHNQINVKEQREFLPPSVSSYLLGVEEF